MRNRFKVKNGFTMIEILVVIAIVGFLVSVAVVAMNNARAKSRDTKRISDVNSIRKALELYYDDKKTTYPTTISYGENVANPSCTGGWDCSYEDQDGAGDGAFIEPLKDYMNEVPLDPVNNSSRHYRYYYYTGTGTYAGCTLPFYVIISVGMETPMGKNDTVCYTPWSGNDYVYVVVGGQK